MGFLWGAVLRWILQLHTLASTRVRISADDKRIELGRVICACVFSVSNFEEVVQMKAENSFELVLRVSFCAWQAVDIAS